MPILPTSCSSPASSIRSTRCPANPMPAGHHAGVAGDRARMLAGAGVADVQRLGQADHGGQLHLAAVGQAVARALQRLRRLLAEDHRAVAALLLGAVQRLVGGAQHAGAVGGVDGEGGDAEADAQRHLVAGEHLADAQPQPLGHLLGLVVPGGGQQQRELLAAHPGGHVGRALPPLQLGRHAAQGSVADVMALAVVDQLEAVEVADQHAQRLARRGRRAPAPRRSARRTRAGWGCRSARRCAPPRSAGPAARPAAGAGSPPARRGPRWPPGPRPSAATRWACPVPQHPAVGHGHETHLQRDPAPAQEQERLGADPRVEGGVDAALAVEVDDAGDGRGAADQEQRHAPSGSRPPTASSSGPTNTASTAVTTTPSALVSGAWPAASESSTVDAAREEQERQRARHLLLPEGVLLALRSGDGGQPHTALSGRGRPPLGHVVLYGGGPVPGVVESELALQLIRIHLDGVPARRRAGFSDAARISKGSGWSSSSSSATRRRSWSR